MVTTGDDMAAIHHQGWSTVESMVSDSLRLCVGDCVAQLDGGAAPAQFARISGSGMRSENVSGTNGTYLSGTFYIKNYFRHSGAGRTKARSALNAHRAARRVSEANNPGKAAIIGTTGSRPAPG